MTHDEAIQHALGYAAGREDASGIKTSATGYAIPGFMAFADAYAAGWDDYRTEHRYHMVNAHDAYGTWQASNGRTIFRDEPAGPEPSPAQERQERTSWLSGMEGY